MFLATPHRGVDLAQLLSRVLNLSPGARPFVKDLHRNSLATQSINDEFPQYSRELQIYSFYETLPMAYGIGKSLIVEKDAAILGYTNEIAAYLNANHREICKYNSVADTNYQIVRNALASAMDSLREAATPLHVEINKEQRRILDGFLGVTEAPKDYFMDIDNVRLTGSCEWLLRRESFREWRDSSNTSLYWITAKPATGKTILSGKVIHHLTSCGRDTAFYFFDYRNKAQTTISSFLLSMAGQMAHTHLNVMHIVLEICGKDDQLGKADYRTIWRKLFVEGILRIKLTRPQFWIIDALDESRNESELVPLLLKIVESRSARILLTSRNSFESSIGPSKSTAKIVFEEILTTDTKSDIALYLESNMHQLPAIDEEARQDMVSTILAKSAGCFLWVILILQELRRAHTSTEIRQVLEEVPSNMTDLYSRILNQMSKAPTYSKVLAKAILTWTVCAARPLTTLELHQALQMDIKDKIDNVQASIESRCGQLIYVDLQSRVRMIHQTARDYLLLASDDSEFGIDRKMGHRRLLMTCLDYLNSSEMRGQKHRKLSAGNVTREQNPFAKYACDCFFEHITHVSSQDDVVLVSLGKFLSSSNVFAWIEFTAQNSDLRHLIKAANAFKNFLQRRLRYLSPFGRDNALLDAWAIDLTRLVTKFGGNLKTLPSSINHLIPPFCPPDTALRKYFLAPQRGITVVGLSSLFWDDCLSTIVKPEEHFSALASSDKFFAVGTSSGMILIYNKTTCLEIRKLEHQESVTLLSFGCRIDILVSAGSRQIRLWNSSWELIWEAKIPQQCMSVAVFEEDQLLFGALRNNHLVIWDLFSGIVRDTIDWTEDVEGPQSYSFRRPIVAAFCIESCLLAVVYRGQDIYLWNVENYVLHDTYNRKGSSSRNVTRGDDAGVICLAFSVVPNATFLAAGYSDGELLLFDTAEGIVKEAALVNAQTLACSPDGRTLATGDSSGTIQLFEFDTLRPLYRINSDEYCIRHLAFSGDSHRLMDIRRSECRVWDPTVLVRQDSDEQNSDTISISTGPQETSLECAKDIILITSLACHGNGEVFFCGKEDGSVYLYETCHGRQSHKLFCHAYGVIILSLEFDDQSSMLVSLDVTSRFMVHRIVHRQHGWEATEALLDHHAGAAIQQMLINPGSSRLLISSANSDTLWSISSEGGTVIAKQEWVDRTSYRWETHPLNHNHMLLLMGTVVHLYDWQTMNRITDSEGILLAGSMLPELSIQSITPCFDNTVLATAFSDSPRSQSKSKLILWNTSDFTSKSKVAAPIPKYRTLADQVRSLIGTDGRRLVFLHSNSWVSSAEAKAKATDDCNRHFFIPADWLTSNVKMMTEVTCKGDIIFVKGDEVAVIRRGLQNVEPQADSLREVPSKRPSLLGRNRSPLRSLYGSS